MTPSLLDTALVCRQVAILRRSGCSRHQALALAADAYGQGPLGGALAVARRRLEAGVSASPDDELLVRVLTHAQAAPERLDWTADAIDARLAAIEATRLARFGLTAATSGTLVLATALAWMLPDADLALLRFIGLPTAAVSAATIHLLGHRMAPGVVQLEAAAELWTAGGHANRDAPLPHLDTARELRALGQRRAAAFCDLLPVLGVATTLLSVGGVLVVASLRWLHWLGAL